MTKKRLSIKQLESYLQNLDDFESPKVGLEQYATPPHIAAHMLDIVNSNYNDLEGKFVADLGCGTGRLSVGSLLCGATYVIGFDIDGDALRTSLQSLGEGESDEDIGSCAYQSFPNLNFIQADVADESADDFWRSFEDKFDTVIMNPPFGTKVNAGLDMVFLKRALKLTTGVVYSLHKTSTRKYIQNKCQEWGVNGKPITQIRYNLDNTYKFHQKKSLDIDVDLWRITSSP